MADVINTNVMSLIAQQNLTNSQNSLQTAMQRLSSGLRINSAADDPAGYAIAQGMTSQVNGLTQAQQNANDGISVAQTAEGALQQITNDLQTIRTLTVQAQNGTNSASDKAAIQTEVQANLDEINRISSQSEFNGINILSKNQTLNIQVGANDGQTIGVSLQGVTTSTLGLSTFSVTGDTAATASEVIGKMGNGDTVTVGPAATAITYTMSTGGTAFTAAAATGDTGTPTLPTPATGISAASVAAAVNNSVTAGNAATLVVGANTYTAAATTGAITDGGAAVYSQEGTGDLITTGVKPATANPLAVLDDALNSVNTMSANLGATQNRLQSAVQQLQTTTTNLSQARSRIQDANYAQEVSYMTQDQILQQAGTSVLSKANQIPDSVLTLLQNA